MRRLMTWATAALLPAFFASAVLIGCGGNETKDGGPGKTDTGPKADKGDKDKKGKGKAAKEELASTGWGKLTGKVTLEGAEPNLATMDADIKKLMEANQQDGKFCLMGGPDETNQQKWQIGKDKGVQNVFVWLAPPDGKFFKVDWDKKSWPSEVTIDQPHCAFKPHAVILFPEGPDPADPKKTKPTGQKFQIKNSASINHNTMWKGGPDNPGDNVLIKAGGERTVEVKPDPKSIDFHCDIHKWMDAVARAYDHPYATLTDKDGNFTIDHVPAGVELHIVVWHEVGGFGPGGEKGEKKILQAGENSYNATIKAQ
jgi:hypothetical protein